MLNKKFGVILLAAGRSTRFGQNKLLTLINDRPMLLETFAVYRQCFDLISVIINPEDVQVQELLIRLQINYLICPGADKGMGESLSFGVTQNSEWDGWFIALSDMPYIQVSTLSALKKSLQKHQIVAPRYNMQRGNPVGFSRHYYSQLCLLSGDCGAQNMLQEHAQTVELIDVDDQGVIIDIDRVEDVFFR